MKNILITGKNSYIGTSLENWLMREPDKYKVDTVDMKDGTWKEMDFSSYDVVFHVAGIAHIKETSDNQDLYYKVNRDLAYETAQKAKQDGVEQFIFLSSMSVYGIENGVINRDTPLKPNSAYGKSKIEAEDLINKLQDDSFTVATLRPPMVYGKGCRGNYPRLAGLALKTPVFPKVENKRSMIYVDNLSEFVKQLIDNKSGGLFFPQNAEYVNTSEMVKLIAEVHGKKILMTKLFNPLLRLLNVSTVNKVFGDLVYDMNMSEYESDYRVCGSGKSILKTEGARE
ncbi:NAD-dependent epimerase/dehydratase family protein [Isachenkonia alkalipeptolytica]|uniref:NAD-dependent epimerase/dehydratase family protein n=1 Tax=Isachenkonia alkalipeptolytica TaxID=2565777 RepID=A0AA44BF47_9CLOT|nr:NAD-dependent epimerase/dehydratase family protein [Isachenkonia alkalipeptolytica]NBG89623.1 NAD-dependent epimerase/dehydratase family protein [Isachenkonia alkalipeptolytica]